MDYTMLLYAYLTIGGMLALVHFRDAVDFSASWLGAIGLLTLTVLLWPIQLYLTWKE